MKAIASFRQTICVIGAAMVLVLVPIASNKIAISTAHAQEAGEQRRGGGLLRFLFPRKEKRERPTAPQVQQKKPPAQRRVAAPVTPPPPEVEKAEDAKRILVIGDFLAGSLADGLATAYAENANMLVVDRANGSSGLVRDDYYDWPGNIAAILDAEKPAAVVMMIGANDRQPLRVGSNHEQPGSEAWIGEYQRRAKALAKTISDRKLPLLWVGALPFKSSVMTSDMVVFNDLYRRIVTDAGGEFINVWDGFVDESGSFAANGPDMNGQPAQLRGSDGINVTRPGRRKIAFYVEKPLARLLGLDGSDTSLALPSEPGPETIDPAAIDRTQPVAIDDLSAKPGTALLGAVIVPVGSAAIPPAKLAAPDAAAPSAPTGRADNFTLREPASESGSATAGEQK